MLTKQAPKRISSQAARTYMLRGSYVASVANHSEAGSRTGSSRGSSTGSSTRTGIGPLPPQLAGSPSLLRRLLSAATSHEATDICDAAGITRCFTEDEALALMTAALERGNTQLALSIHNSMCAARQSSGSPGGSGSSPRASPGLVPAGDTAVLWPATSVRATCSLVLGLCRQLAVKAAVEVVGGIRGQGLASNDEAVGFGKVIASPLAPQQTLTVVQPQEGCKLVADAYSKYEYEVFSGKVISVKSEALQPGSSLLRSLLRAAGILRKPAAAAVHEFVVQAPDGTSRTFRVATPTADVPAQITDRVTLVCSPSPGAAKTSARKRKQGLLPPIPANTLPGEALTATNHMTGIVTPLLRPPTSNTQSGLPGWVMPVAILVAGGDAASTLVDPNLPLLLAGSLAAVAGSAVAGNQLLLPRLRQLPDKSLSLEYIRQQLLGQYAQLAAKVEGVVSESGEDVRVLARLWQLQNKMQSVSAGAAATYGARMERVAAARANIEQRLVKKLELLDGYARVMHMIEIEVEMDIEVPAAELAGIQQQMERLTELEGLQDDWRIQAEARDEVERLLKVS
ncbi:hypothetical protein V8C86DRAFT_3019801 [Haematococcus lacustris]